MNDDTYGHTASISSQQAAMQQLRIHVLCNLRPFITLPPSYKDACWSVCRFADVLNMCYAFYNCEKNKLVKYFICQWLQASIVKYEESSAGFYAWLQMTPLTEGQLLQQVLLPNFEDVPQKTVLDRVLQAGAWKTDAELRDALASIAFVTKGLLQWQPCMDLYSSLQSCFSSTWRASK